MKMSLSVWRVHGAQEKLQEGRQEEMSQEVYISRNRGLTPLMGTNYHSSSYNYVNFATSFLPELRGPT